jgi:hypothetical protein
VASSLFLSRALFCFPEETRSLLLLSLLIKPLSARAFAAFIYTHIKKERETEDI